MPATEEPEESATDNAVPDVLPPMGNQIMAGLWLLLFGTRWLLIPPLIYFGVLRVEQVASWDQGLLLRCYLLLLAVTILVVALRAVRGWQAQHSPSSSAVPSSSIRRSQPRD